MHQAPPATPPKEPSPRALQDLLETLRDDNRRADLVERIEALLALHEEPPPPPEAPGLVGALASFFGDMAEQVRTTAVDLVEQAALLPDRIRGLLQDLEEPGAFSEFLAGAARGGAVLLLSLLAGFAVWSALRRPKAALEARPKDRDPGPLGRALRMVGRVGLEALPPVALLAAAFVAFAVLAPPPAARAVVLAAVGALAAHRLGVVAVQWLFSPRVSWLRLLPLPDDQAVPLAATLARLVALAAYGFFFVEACAALGAEEALVQPLRNLYGLALLVAGVLLVLRERARLRSRQAEPSAPAAPEAPAEKPATPWRSLLLTVGGLWWLAAIAYMVGLYMVWAAGVEGGFAFLVRATLLSGLIVAVAALLLVLVRKGGERLLAAGVAALARHPEVRSHLPQYVGGVRLFANVVIFALAFCFALEAWGVSALQAVASPTGRDVLAALMGILLVVLLAAASIDLATAFTQRYLEAKEREGAASAKVRTLVPLARNAIKLVVVVLASIMVLSQAGLQIGPILAGVGVLGLAVGFGAQTLVKDIITGVFLLLEDTVSVGDIAVVNGTGGQVEAINIRTIRLRDLAGAVHTIPYSSVGHITNLTKDFSRYLVEAAVAYREDVDEVIEILKELGAEMQKDPVFGPDIIAPIEILGLDRFEDSAVVIRARLITKPIKQWGVGREFLRRMKKVFDERGIEIPFPHRTLYMGELKDGSSPPLRVLMGGGQDAATGAEPPPAAPAGTGPGLGQT